MGSSLAITQHNPESLLGSLIEPGLKMKMGLRIRVIIRIVTVIQRLLYFTLVVLCVLLKFVSDAQKLQKKRILIRA